MRELRKPPLCRAFVLGTENTLTEMKEGAWSRNCTAKDLIFQKTGPPKLSDSVRLTALLLTCRYGNLWWKRWCAARSMSHLSGKLLCEVDIVDGVVPLWIADRT